MARRKKGTGSTPGVQFRLGEDVLEKLDLIAAHLSDDTGNPHTRSDAVRTAIQELWKRVRRSKPDTGKDGAE